VRSANSPATASWTIKAREVCFRSPRFLISKYFCRTADGQKIAPYYVHEAPDSVLCTPVTHDGSIVLVEQYRLPLRRASLDFPAGRVEPGDASPAAAALRELREETGYIAKEATPILSLDKDPGFSICRMHIFLVQDVVKVDPYKSGERVDVRLLHGREVLKAISDGRLSCAFCVAAALRVGQLLGWEEV